ncbi:hypothetical protein MUK42_25527 [Musa troglodytarum]|uniref:Uncharacterized protein n=1 Tax=Musa troglodytarum TaxID=320322 RepID=A0A9E7KQ10_9LILI|nr:hypothetical protein MUK42_25527 [Musa troglodytarum]
MRRAKRRRRGEVVTWVTRPVFLLLLLLEPISLSLSLLCGHLTGSQVHIFLSRRQRLPTGH